MGRQHEDYTRHPCPYRIPEDAGGAFLMGVVGGGGWHAFKGLRNSPQGQRLHGMRVSIAHRSPQLGVAFAVWGVTFSTVECSIIALRQEEGPMNSIAAGAITGGVLAIRGGIMPALVSAGMGGLILAAIEGLQIVLGKTLSSANRQQRMQAQMQMEQAQGGTQIDSSEYDEFSARSRAEPTHDNPIAAAYVSRFGASGYGAPYTANDLLSAMGLGDGSDSLLGLAGLSSSSSSSSSSSLLADRMPGLM